jgi:hypothetical protein
LLIKHRDQFASAQADIAEKMPRSAVSNRLLAEIARDEGGNVAVAATGDPESPRADASTDAPAKSPRASAVSAPKSRAKKTPRSAIKKTAARRVAKPRKKSRH